MMMQKNPWLSAWLRAANSWSGGARGLWAAEAQRTQTAMIQEWMKQAMRFWSGAWLVPASQGKTPDRRRTHG